MASGAEWAMEKWQAFVLAILFLIAIFFVPPQIVWATVLISSLWASFDAGKIGAKNYQSGASPATIFIACLLLWIAVFPWYLYFRSHAKAGLLKKKAVTTDAMPVFVDAAPDRDTLNR